MKDKPLLSTIICCVLAFVAGLLFGNGCGISLGRRQVREEAAMAGFAMWVPDKRGAPEFRWRWSLIKHSLNTEEAKP